MLPTENIKPKLHREITIRSKYFIQGLENSTFLRNSHNIILEIIILKTTRAVGSTHIVGMDFNPSKN